MSRKVLLIEKKWKIYRKSGGAGGGEKGPKSEEKGRKGVEKGPKRGLFRALSTGRERVKKRPRKRHLDVITVYRGEKVPFQTI